MYRLDLILQGMYPLLTLVYLLDLFVSHNQQLHMDTRGNEMLHVMLILLSTVKAMQNTWPLGFAHGSTERQGT